MDPPKPSDSLYWTKEEEALCAIYFNKDTNAMMLAALLNRESACLGVKYRKFSAINVSQKWKMSQKPTIWIPDDSDATPRISSAPNMSAGEPSGSQLGEKNKPPVAIMASHWRPSVVAEGGSRMARNSPRQLHSNLQNYAGVPSPDVGPPGQRTPTGIPMPSAPLSSQVQSSPGQFGIRAGVFAPRPESRLPNQQIQPRTAESQPVHHPILRRHALTSPYPTPLITPQYVSLSEIQTTKPTNNLLCISTPTIPANVVHQLDFTSMRPSNFWSKNEEILARNVFRSYFTPAVFADRLNAECRHRNICYRPFTAANVSQKWQRMEGPTIWIGEEAVIRPVFQDGQTRAQSSAKDGAGVTNGKERVGFGGKERDGHPMAKQAQVALQAQLGQLAPAQQGLQSHQGHQGQQSQQAQRLWAPEQPRRNPAPRRWGVQQFIDLAHINDKTEAKRYRSASLRASSESPHEYQPTFLAAEAEREKDINVCELECPEHDGWRSVMTGFDGDPFMGSSYSPRIEYQVGGGH